MTNDYDGAVDLAQETFLRVYRAAGRYQTTHAFSTYIYRIATNLAISELRKRKRRRLVSLTGLVTSSDGQEPRDFDAPDDRPLQDGSLETVTAPANFDLRLRARIAAERQGVARQSFFSGFALSTPAMAVAALVVVSAASIVWFVQRRQIQTAPIATYVESTAPVNQQ